MIIFNFEPPGSEFQYYGSLSYAALPQEAIYSDSSSAILAVCGKGPENAYGMETHC